MNHQERNYRDIFSALALLIIVWAVTSRLVSTNWTDDLRVIQLNALLAAILGYLVGMSAFSRKTTRLILAALSIFFLAWQISDLGQIEGLWSEKGFEIMSRAVKAVSAFITNQPVQEPTLFLLFMLLLFWFAALLSAYRLARYGSPWVPLLVLVFVLLIMNVYPPVSSITHFYSGMSALVLVIMLSRVFFLRHQQRWRATQTTIDYGVDLDLLKYAVTAGLVLVIAAWSLPYLTAAIVPESEENAQMRDLWRPLQTRLSNMFNSLRRQPGTRTDFYGTSMPLGIRATEGDELLFKVKTDPDKPKGIRFYWHSTSYDYYESGAWRSTIGEREVLEADEWSGEKPVWNSRQVIDLTITSQTLRTHSLYSLGYILGVDVDSEILAQVISEGNSASQLRQMTPTPPTVSSSTDPEVFRDQISLEALLSIERGKSYNVQSWLAVPAITQMRAAETVYPAWVTERYLQLPEDLPERVKLLAEELTKDQTNNFDRAMEITRFLRTEMVYSASAPQAPEGSEPIDWFLFEGKQGFCNYYASAEVLMLRSIGIPARLAAGFSEGDYDSNEEAYVVKIGNSHAWPEVFFPGLGWIEFEPTASEPLPAFLNAKVSASPALNFVIEDYISEPTSAEERYQERLERLREIMMDDEMDFTGNVTDQVVVRRLPVGWLVAGGVLLLMLLVPRLPYFRRRPIPVLVDRLLSRSGGTSPAVVRVLAHRARMSEMEKLFSQLDWMDFLLHGKTSSAHTPAELADSIQRGVPEAAADLEILVREYDLSSYSSQPGDIKLARQALTRVWGAVLKRWLNQLIRKQDES